MLIKLRNIPIPYWIIAAITILTHGWLLLNDGIYWDGWTSVYFPLAEGDWNRLHDLYASYGYPIRAYLHWLASQLPSIVLGHKLTVLVCLFLSAIWIYQIFQAFQFFTRAEALFLALFFLTFPAYQVTIELIMMPYSVAYCGFLGGVRAVLWMQTQTHWRFWLGRGLALLLFLFSFWIYSFLTFYFGMWLLLFLRGYTGENLWREGWYFIRRHLDFFLLPFLFWVILQRVFQPEAYYSTDVSSGVLIPFLQFFQNSLYHPFAVTLQLLLNNPLYLGLWVLVMVGLGQKNMQLPALKAPDLWLAAGGIWLLLAIIPYVALGFYPTAEGWWTRHSLLISLPLGYCLLMLNRRFSQWLSRPPALALLLSLTLPFGLLTIQNYLNWQGRWVKDHAIITTLEAHPEYEDTSIFWVVDRFPMGSENRYRFHEWSAFFRMAWGGEKRAGLTLDAYPLSNLILRGENQAALDEVYLQDWDLQGCQTLLIIEQGARPEVYRDEWGLSVRYWAYKFLQPARLDEFLQSTVTLDFRRIVAPQAIHCQRQNELAPLTWLNPDMEWRDHLIYLNTLILMEENFQQISNTALEANLMTTLSQNSWQLPLSEQETQTLAKFDFDVAWYKAYKSLVILEPQPYQENP